jgi:hypothetical protein
MASRKKSPLAAHRERMKQRGLMRIEVMVRRTDAPLIRNIARALADPERGPESRAFLVGRFSPVPGKNLKELLASAPLAGIDLTRDRSPGRDIDL